MDFIPGGIPASEGFDYDKTLKNYPDVMLIQRGNMPVFNTYLGNFFRMMYTMAVTT